MTKINTNTSEMLPELIKFTKFIHAHATHVGCRITTPDVIMATSRGVMATTLMVEDMSKALWGKDISFETEKVPNKSGDYDVKVIDGEDPLVMDALHSIVAAVNEEYPGKQFTDLTICERLRAVGIYTFGYREPKERHWYKGDYPTSTEITAAYDAFVDSLDKPKLTVYDTPACSCC